MGEEPAEAIDGRGIGFGGDLVFVLLYILLAFALGAAVANDGLHSVLQLLLLEGGRHIKVQLGGVGYAYLGTHPAVCIALFIGFQIFAYTGLKFFQTFRIPALGEFVV